MLPMTHTLFNTIVDREHNARASSSLGMQSSRSPAMAPNAYWAADHTVTPSDSTGRSVARDYEYSQYRSSSLLAKSRSNTISASGEDYGRQSDSSNPTIDFSGLIPMYSGQPGSPEMGSREEPLDLSYDNEWPTSNMAQYATFQRNKGSLWQSSHNQPSQPWDTSISSGSSLTQHFHDYVPYSPLSPYSSTTSSSSPSPIHFINPSAKSSTTSRRGNRDQTPAKKSCFHCHVTSTPLWRREPTTQRPLCNACGLYLQQRNKLRPQELIDADADDDDEPQIPDSEYTGPKCSHCLTRQTSVWRRSKTGAQVCNACGVYARLRGKQRPLSLRRNKIKPRTKHSR